MGRGGVRSARGSVEELGGAGATTRGWKLGKHQTGDAGRRVRRLLIAEGADIKKELYVAMVVDRVVKKVVLMASSEGGMDIEEVAETTPEETHKAFVDLAAALKDAEEDAVVAKIGINAASVTQQRAEMQPVDNTTLATGASLPQLHPPEPSRHVPGAHLACPPAQ